MLSAFLQIKTNSRYNSPEDTHCSLEQPVLLCEEYLPRNAGKLGKPRNLPHAHQQMRRTSGNLWEHH